MVTDNVAAGSDCPCSASQKLLETQGESAALFFDNFPVEFMLAQLNSLEIVTDNGHVV
jgi:hypothetical protein